MLNATIEGYGLELQNLQSYNKYTLFKNGIPIASVEMNKSSHRPENVKFITENEDLKRSTLFELAELAFYVSKVARVSDIFLSYLKTPKSAIIG